MSDNVWVLVGQLLVFLAAVFTVVWGARKDRGKPKVDSAEAEHTGVDSDRLRQTIEDMNEQSNARRDRRLAEFHGYLLVDYEWHLIVMTNERRLMSLIGELVRMLRDLGGDVSHIDMPQPSPAPPAVPPALPLAGTG